MKGRHALSASAVLLFVAFFGSVYAQSPAPADCQSLDLNDSSEDALAQRLACYHGELDSLSQLIGNLLEEREQLSAVLNGSQPIEISEDASTEQLNTIERLRLERSELSAQLHRQLIENQEKLLDEEAEERLLRNYSQAYLAIADENAELVARINALNQRIAKQNQANTALNDSNGQYAQESKTYRATIADLSAKRTQLTRDVQQQTSLITKLRAQLIDGATLGEQLSRNVDSLQQELAAAQHANTIAEGNMQHLNVAIARFTSSTRNEQQLHRDQLKELHSRLEQAAADNTKLTEAAEISAEEFRKRYDAQVAEITSLKSSLTAAEKTRDSLQAQLEAADQLLAEQNDTLTRITGTNNEQQQNIASLNADIVALNKQLADRQQALQSVSTDADANREELANTQEKLAAKTAEFDTTSNALSSAKRDIAELESRVDTLNAQLTGSNNRYDQLQRRLNTTSVELETMSQNRAVALAASDSLLTTNNKLRQNLRTATAQLQQADTEGELLAAKIIDLDTEKAAAAEEIESLQQQVASLQTLFDQSQRNNEEFATSLENIKLELSSSSDRLAEQQNQLQSLVDEKEAIVETLNRSQTETQQLAQVISNNLQSQGQSDTVSVDILADNTIGLGVASSQLFRVGSSRLSTEGQLLLENIATALPDTSKRRILIEGHSDNLPLGPKLAAIFKDNMGLSMARALSAANFLAEDTRLPEQQLSIAGAGDTRPVATNDTPAGRQQNRRVEILLLPLDFTASAQ